MTIEKYVDKTTNINRSVENEWTDFEKVREEHFDELVESISVDKYKWSYFSKIPQKVCEFHNERGVNPFDFGGDVNFMPICKFMCSLVNPLPVKLYEIPEIEDSLVEHIFQYRFGTSMLERYDYDKYFFDSSKYLEDCEFVSKDIHPCKVLFRSEKDKLVLEEIIILDDDFGFGDEKFRTHRVKKAILMANALTVYHICFHLTYQHIWAENVFCKCMKFLDNNHWIYKLLSPICGEAGLINRSWGLYSITGLKEHHMVFGKKQKEKSLCIADTLFINRDSCKTMIKNAQELYHNKDPLILDEDTGVLYFAYQNFVSDIVDKMFEVEQVKTTQWFIKTFKMEFTKSNLKHELTNLIFMVCPEHDRAHDDFMVYNSDYTIPQFEIENQIPKVSYKVRHHINAIADSLNPLFSSNPQTCWERFATNYELESSYVKLQEILNEIYEKDNFINQYGAMTH